MSTFHCPGPISRRQALQIGAIGATGFGLGDLFRLRAEASLPNVPNDTSVILVWCPGGISQLDTYDMKPDAPHNYRGPFNPIKTNVSGIELTELFPLHAKIADKFTLIRSMNHKFSDHGGGHKRVMTGFDPKTPTGFLNDKPAVPSIVSKFRSNMGGIMPPNILLGDNKRSEADIYALGSAWLGPSYNPFEVSGDPSSSDFRINSITLHDSIKTRLEDRLALLNSLDKTRRDIDVTGSMSALDLFNAKAYDLFTSSSTKEAFDLSLEPDIVRDRYGRHSYGQRCLLSRRLVEAGSSFVTVILENPPENDLVGKKPKGVTYNWDCHAVNCNLEIDTKFRAASYDQALTALIEDIYSRGLDKKVLVVATGEFGHTPLLENWQGRPGRGHWPNVFSLLISGGGLSMGQVIGSSDSRASYPKDRPLNPQDLWATIYKHLGIDASKTLVDNTGRPIVISSGQPIKELL